MVLKCPYCQHEGPPYIQTQVSATGWLIFVLLLIFCLPLCWIPFVVEGTKEEIKRCTKCGSRIG